MRWSRLIDHQLFLVLCLFIINGCYDSTRSNKPLPPEEDKFSSSPASAAAPTASTTPTVAPLGCSGSPTAPITISIRQRGEHGDFNTSSYYDELIRLGRITSNPLVNTDSRFKVRLRVLPDPRGMLPIEPNQDAQACGFKFDEDERRLIQVRDVPYSYLTFNLRVSGTVPAFEENIVRLPINTTSSVFTINPALTAGAQEIIISRPQGDGFGAGYCSGTDCFISPSNCWSLQLEVATDCTEDF